MIPYRLSIYIGFNYCQFTLINKDFNFDRYFMVIYLHGQANFPMKNYIPNIIIIAEKEAQIRYIDIKPHLHYWLIIKLHIIHIVQFVFHSNRIQYLKCYLMVKGMLFIFIYYDDYFDANFPNFLYLIYFTYFNFIIFQFLLSFSPCFSLKFIYVFVFQFHLKFSIKLTVFFILCNVFLHFIIFFVNDLYLKLFLLFIIHFLLLIYY